MSINDCYDDAKNEIIKYVAKQNYKDGFNIYIRNYPSLRLISLYRYTSMHPTDKVLYIHHTCQLPHYCHTYLLIQYITTKTTQYCFMYTAKDIATHMF